MPSALPPVTDCGCSSASSASASSGSCCPESGVNDPNFDGLVPANPAQRVSYLQLADLIAGPVAQVWYWNPALAVWQ